LKDCNTGHSPISPKKTVPEVKDTETSKVPKSSFNCPVCMNTLAFEDLHIYYCPRCEAIWKIEFLRLKEGI